MKTNKILDRIQQEGCTIVTHDEPNHSFAFGYEQQVFVPKGVALDTPKSQFALAHELGHVYQFKVSGYVKKRANTYCRGNTVDSRFMHSILFSIFLLWIELDAWVKGYRICQQEGISTKGFFAYAWHCYKSYIKHEVKKTVCWFAPLYPVLTLIGYIVTPDINWATFWFDSIWIYGFILSVFEFANVSFVLIDAYVAKREEKETKNDKKEWA